MAISRPLFESKPPTSGYLVTTNKGGLVDFLVPKGTGAVDVINNYRWTLTQHNDEQQAREETPKAILKEYRMLQSALVNSARYYAVGASQQLPGGQQQSTGNQEPYITTEPGMQGYQGLFDYSNGTGFEYTFPYFNEVSNEVDSTWTTLDILEKIKGATNYVSPQIGEMVDLAAGAYMFGKEANYPRVGVMDRPKLWESSNFRTINIRFPLFNTYDFNDIKDNWDLCYLLMFQNMFNKRDFITAIPPVFYRVYIPGQFFSIAMYVSNLKIYNRGNIRNLDIDGTGKKRNIPDVYEIDMTLTDMVMPSQNMMRVLQNEDPVTVENI
jgi:hypothetical protein